MNTSPGIPDRSMTGSKWDKFSFATWAETVKPKSKPYKVNVTKILMQMSKTVRREIGQIRSTMATTMWRTGEKDRPTAFSHRRSQVFCRAERVTLRCRLYRPRSVFVV